jgi:hypothetical protein
VELTAWKCLISYVLGDILALGDRLGQKPVSSGANVTLLAPSDEGVFYGEKGVERAPIISPVQLHFEEIGVVA